jgi:hypothetical protein
LTLALAARPSVGSNQDRFHPRVVNSYGYGVSLRPASLSNTIPPEKYYKGAVLYHCRFRLAGVYFPDLILISGGNPTRIRDSADFVCGRPGDPSSNPPHSLPRAATHWPELKGRPPTQGRRELFFRDPRGGWEPRNRENSGFRRIIS